VGRLIASSAGQTERGAESRILKTPWMRALTFLGREAGGSPASARRRVGLQALPITTFKNASPA
jgi:hypothetical protein